MKTPRNYCRAVILFFKQNLSYNQNHQNLVAAFGDNTHSLVTVSYWLRAFRPVRCTLKNKRRPEWPAVAIYQHRKPNYEKLEYHA